MKALLIICSLMFSFNAMSWWDKKDNKKMSKVSKSKKKIKRKVAATYNASDIGSDLSALGKSLQALEIKAEPGKNPTSADIYASVEALEKIMTDTIAKAKTKPKTEDEAKFIPYQMVAGNFKVHKELRGIVWRMRPLFEYRRVIGKNKGNKMMHMSAVQLLRTISTGIDDYIPNDQANLMFHYINTPKKEWTVAKHQFDKVEDLQYHLYNTMVPVLAEQAKKLAAIYKKDAEGNKYAVNYVFDNQWAFGSNTFPDNAKRYSSIGPGEMLLIISSIYRTQHDFSVFASRKFNGLLDLIGKLGVAVGIDSFLAKQVFDPSELGLSDKERIDIVRPKMNRGFLKIRNKTALKNAKTYLIASMDNYTLAYDYFKDYPKFSETRQVPKAIQETSERAYKNIKALIKGAHEVKDPLTGKSVTVNIHPFYDSPPVSLAGLLPNSFNSSSEQEYKITSSTSRSDLKFRNYNFGQSTGWSSSNWRPYVKIKSGDLMEAKRIMANSGGVFKLFRLPLMFIR